MKEFVENLLPQERNLFFFLNGSDFVFLDNLMSTVSSRWIWIPLYAFVVFMFFYKTPYKQALLVSLFAILVFVLSDQISSGLIKPFFERLRPGKHPDFKDFVDIVNNYRGGGFSFISGHATNSFGFAVFLSLLLRNRWLTFITLVWAALISYSRIYLGVHFISDVIGGIIVGTLIAISLYAVLILLMKRIFHLNDLEKTKIYSKQNSNLLALVFGSFSLFVMFIVSWW